MADFMQAPLLFPCANRVKMPHVGADETNLKPQKTIHLDRAPVRPFTKTAPSVDHSYLQTISSDLLFSEDVVRERGFHTLPYDTKYFKEALNISDLVPRAPKAPYPPGRHNVRGEEKKHIPCHIKKRSTHKLKPMKRKILDRAIEMHNQAIKKKEENEKDDVESVKSPVFLTETEAEKMKEEIPDKSWDDYLMSILSERTARWIVSEHVSEREQNEKLSSLLNTYHGPDPEEKVELVKDNTSENGSEDTFRNQSEEQTKKNWKKGDESLLDRVRELQQSTDGPTDPYADDTAAAFYRLPAGFRRAKKNLEKEEAGACNTTAYNIEVKRYEPPPPPCISDFINPKVGDKVFETQNMFQQEWLTGAQQVHIVDEDPKKIIMDSNNKYRKKLQQVTPREPDTWYSNVAAEKLDFKEKSHTITKVERGMHRWKELPEPIDDTAEKLNLQMESNLVPKTPNPASRKQARDNNTLVQIVTDWRGKWNLDMRYADANPDDLIRDMADIHIHIRLKAITTCARAAEYRPPPEPGIVLQSKDKQVSQIKLLPDRLFIALECCLDDEHEQVRRAASIALYTLEKPVPKAEEILRTTLREAKCVDRWTAAQCLAYYGECDSEVVGELVQQLLNTEDNIRHERAASLLSRLSENSTLVHSMIGEQLNSSSWRHRVMACKILPKLHGQINRDLAHKLTQLMWADWHSEVRKAAAQTLGKTGHGKNVHDELRQKIIDGTERDRVEAVSKVGHLGIMTAKLLPVFLDCFDDVYVSVRMEACITCTNLRIQEEKVLKKLLFLATYDPIWKVKALAFQALAEIEEVNSEIRGIILWALRYEDNPAVRAEACNAVIKLGLKDNDVTQILQDRFLVETSELVKRQITRALELFGISPTEDMDMVTQIKNEVRKLCTRNNICAHISVREEDDDRQANINRMIYRDEDAMAGIYTRDNFTRVLKRSCLEGKKKKVPTATLR